MIARIVAGVLAGLAAAFATVACTDLVRVVPIPERMSGLTAEEARQHVLGAVLFGTFLAVALAAAAEHARGRVRPGVRLLLAVPVGAVAAFVGVNFGMTAMAALYADPARNPVQFLGNVLARAIAWAIIGAFVGAADGARLMRAPIVRNGVLGGAIGGALGGACFEIVPWLMPGLRAGGAARLVGFSITGTAVGLCTALVREWVAEAWLRVATGRNEGKDHLLDQLEHVVGRSEIADVPVFGDPAVARRHLIVRRAHGGWEAVDTGESPEGFRVNDRKVSGTAPLRDGDRIGVGGRELHFRVRATSNPTVAAPREPARAATTPAAAIPTVPGNRTAMGAGAPIPAGRLVVVSGPHAGTVFPLSVPVEIGRDATAGIPLPSDRKASRRHAALSPVGDGWELEDRGSTNGTFVNGQRIQRLRLAPGDTVLVGESALRLDP